MERLTTDSPNGNFETMLNFVYEKDGWAYIRHDGEHENVKLTDWAKRRCLIRGCDEVFTETPEEIDQRLYGTAPSSPQTAPSTDGKPTHGYGSSSSNGARSWKETDMDYKELIEQLNAYSAKHRFHGGIAAEAADAIETLLVERNAAMADLRLRTCSVCRHKDIDMDDEPCRYCYRKNKFEWRGPQKEGG